MSKRTATRPIAVIAFAMPALALAGTASAQDRSGFPQIAPMSEAEVRSLPAEYRTAPVVSDTTEKVIGADGTEVITRTRRIEAPRAPPASATPAQPGYAHTHAPMMTYAPATFGPAVFERDQWIEECRRRTAGRDRDETGMIIGGLLGAIAGGVAGYEIAGAGSRVLGTALGVGGGGLLGGLIGSLFGGDKKDVLYDCEAALDSYLSQVGPPTRIAAREIAYAPYPAMPAYGYGYPAYGYSSYYAPPPQMVMVPVRQQQQQQVVVRETIREETYRDNGAIRVIPAPRPSPKMIKTDR